MCRAQDERKGCTKTSKESDGGLASVVREEDTVSGQPTRLQRLDGLIQSFQEQLNPAPPRSREGGAPEAPQRMLGAACPRPGSRSTQDRLPLTPQRCPEPEPLETRILAWALPHLCWADLSFSTHKVGITSALPWGDYANRVSYRMTMVPWIPGALQFTYPLKPFISFNLLLTTL